MTPEYSVKAGSYMYGTNLPTSDVDLRGFFMPSLRSVCGIDEAESSKVVNNSEKDEAFWELRRYVKLCCQANPNVLETAFAPEDCVVYRSPLANKVLAYRDSFLSRRIAKTYMGYARSNYMRVLKADNGKYDGKDTMHLVRLVRTGSEALLTGMLRVRRPEDREFFLKIRHNEVPWETIENEFEGHVKLWGKLEEGSPLPPEPDIATISQRVASIVFEQFNRTYDGYR